MMVHPMAGNPTLSHQVVHENLEMSPPWTCTSEPKHKVTKKYISIREHSIIHR